MTNSRFAGFTSLALCAMLAMGPAFAQNAAPAKTAAGAKPPAAEDARKSAFLALSEADRKAAQDALGWLGFYNGVVDGGFGKRTLDAILAYQASVKAPADGIVSTQQLADLKTAADKARASVGFRVSDDAATGIRIGAPLKLLDKRSSSANQTRLFNRDGSMTLDLTALASDAAKLEDIYKRHVADSPDRKVTYKFLKPDAFFVVAGEAAGRKYYMRYEQAPANSPAAGAIRGFMFAYPLADAKARDPLALAIANSFEAFPIAGAKKPGTDTPVDATKAAESKTPAETKPAAPVLTATALVVGPGEALTALREADCKAPRVDGKPVTFAKTDAASGLALLAGDFGKASALTAGSASGDLVVLSLAPNGGKSSLEAANASATALPDGRIALLAALASSAQGAPVFDRQGGLAGIVAPFAHPPLRRGAVIISEPHLAIGVEAVKSLAPIAAAAPTGEALTAGDIARRLRGAIIGVYCGP